MKNRLALFAILVLVASLTLIPISADAKSWNLYVDKMPKNWESQYGNLLYDATKYWENRILGIKFYQVDHAQDADFVVQWASEYQGSLLGYYTPSSDNHYDKPYVAITLGYFDDESVPYQQRKFNLVDADYAQAITTHEIGHAIGFDHSTDANDIMYRSIYDYDNWL